MEDSQLIIQDKYMPFDPEYHPDLWEDKRLIHAYHKDEKAECYIYWTRTNGSLIKLVKLTGSESKDKCYIGTKDNILAEKRVLKFKVKKNEQNEMFLDFGDVFEFDLTRAMEGMKMGADKDGYYSYPLTYEEQKLYPNPNTNWRYSPR